MTLDLAETSFNWCGEDLSLMDVEAPKLPLRGP